MGYRLREVRMERGMSQTELAHKSGVARATIWKLETDTAAETTTKTLLKLAEALGVSVMDIFSCTGV